MLDADDVLDLIRDHYDQDATADDYDLDTITAALNARITEQHTGTPLAGHAWALDHLDDVLAVVAVHEN